MKNLLLRVHVVAKTFNLEIPRCQTSEKSIKVRDARLSFPNKPIGPLCSSVVGAVAVVLA